MFNERLKSYREDLNLNKKDFAEVLGISESYYNLIENGKRSPSKKVMIKLVSHSHKPEEYWLYGVEQKDYVNERDDLKNIYSLLKMLVRGNIISSVNDIFKDIEGMDQVEQLIVTAIKSDLSYMLKKKE